MQIAKKTKQISNTEEQIKSLKELLTDTDYKIIKCSEYKLAGIDMPYDIVALHTDRQVIRDQINELEINT